MSIAGQGATLSEFELRPRRAGELLDVAFRLTKHVIRTMWPVMLVVLVPVSALAALQIVSVSDAATSDDFATAANSSGQSGLSFLSTAVVGLLLTALIPAMYAAHMGSPISSSDALRHGLKRMPMAIVYAILAFIGFVIILIPAFFGVALIFFAVFAVARVAGIIGVIVVGGLFYIGLIVGFLGLAGRFQVGFVSLVLEDIGPFEALKRGFALTKRRWLQFGALSTLLFVLTFIVVLVAAGIGAAVRSSVEGSVGVGLVAFVGYLLYLGIWIPLYAALGLALYVDSRVRDEALDLGQLSSQLSSPTLLG